MDDGLGQGEHPQRPGGRPAVGDEEFVVPLGEVTKVEEGEDLLRSGQDRQVLGEERVGTHVVEDPVQVVGEGVPGPFRPVAGSGPHDGQPVGLHPGRGAVQGRQKGLDPASRRVHGGGRRDGAGPRTARTREQQDPHASPSPVDRPERRPGRAARTVSPRRASSAR